MTDASTLALLPRKPIIFYLIWKWPSMWRASSFSVVRTHANTQCWIWLQIVRTNSRLSVTLVTLVHTSEHVLTCCSMMSQATCSRMQRGPGEFKLKKVTQRCRWEVLLTSEKFRTGLHHLAHWRFNTFRPSFRAGLIKLFLITERVRTNRCMLSRLCLKRNS